MTTESIFKIHDILSEVFGYEKAKEIIITIESIIDRNKEKNGEMPYEQIKSNIYEELIEYFKTFPDLNKVEHS